MYRLGQRRRSAKTRRGWSITGLINSTTAKKEIDRIMKPKEESRFSGIGELFRKRKGGD